VISGRDSRAGAARNDSLDFVKGMLVLIMVLYHWMNYFVTLEWDAYRYLRFLTPSFIFVTGYLVSSVYLSKYPAGDPRLRKRLLERGGKLLLLFTALNLVARLVLGQNDAGGMSVAQQIFRMYVLGTGGAIFEILVPIGYFLCIAPFVVVVAQRLGVSLLAVGVVVALAGAVASLMGETNVVAELLAIGVLGLGVGAIRLELLNRGLRYPLALALAYAAYLAAIRWWNIVFPLQVVGVCLSLLVLYSIAVAIDTQTRVYRRIVVLGQYSLFAYIAQVAALQVFKRAVEVTQLRPVHLLLLFVAALGATVLAVESVSAARTRSSSVDRIYRAVFA